jgi:hypothetical protein
MPAPAKLVTLTQAKTHLNITLPDGDPGDAEIQDRLNEAEAIILGKVKGASGAAVDWVDPVTAPGNVTAAIKLQLAHLYMLRGDDKSEDAEDFEERLHFLLSHYITPGIA